MAISRLRDAQSGATFTASTLAAMIPRCAAPWRTVQSSDLARRLRCRGTTPRQATVTRGGSDIASLDGACPICAGGQSNRVAKTAVVGKVAGASISSHTVATWAVSLRIWSIDSTGYASRTQGGSISQCVLNPPVVVL